MSNILKRFGKLSGFLFPKLPPSFFGFGTGSTNVNKFTKAELTNTYECIPEVSIVINRLAMMCSLGIPKVVNQKDEEIENHPAINLLNNPNPLQDKNELIKEYVVFFSLFGQSFQYSNRAFEKELLPQLFWNINPNFVEVVETGKLYRQTELSDIIEKYEVNYANTEDTYNTDEILFKNEPSITNVIEGGSKLSALNIAISNIKGSYDSRNIFIYKRGAIGLLTPDVGKADEAGFADPPDEPTIQKIQDQYQKTYGPLNNGHAISVTNTPMKWVPINMPVKDLMLFEEIDEDFNRIIDAYGLNRHIFSVTKGSTFDNVKNGLIQAFQDTVIPLMEDWANSLSNEWGLTEKKERLIFDYSHVPVLQSDKEKQSKIVKTQAEAYQILLNNGITDDDAKNIVNL
jgi:hypothetical protein